ncbi:MAG: aconitate hydratase [Candidatus Actinomarina sp.]|jgi:aconitate hydratase|tara:strand:+ start:5783 stop:8044 length:2262 start_codon:yes stop_codon:yes gene_type:complete
MDLSKTPLQLVQQVYTNLEKNIANLRARKSDSLTLAEKILYGHSRNVDEISLNRGEDFGDFLPDRVAMQDATAQMALLQFMQADLPETAVPTTVHCDHLIQAYQGANSDLQVANKTHKEVFDFLRTASEKFNIGFWGPGAGIIHQVVLEQYAFPGGMMIGTDSHTPNAGGLSMVAIGVGGADAVDVMAGMPFNTKIPKLIGVKLDGSLSGWTSPKDIILKVAEILTVKGGTNAIVEYFGEGTKTISTTGKATITNMGAEIGATCSIFPFDEKGEQYLVATGRSDIANLAKDNMHLLTADSEVIERPNDYFDQVIEINLDTLEPHIVGPHTPDLARPVSKLKDDATENNYPTTISSALIGSCTNSSYEDIGRAAFIAREAAKKGLKSKVPLMVTPGSEITRATIERDGYLKDLESIGATVLANACGPCIGQWKRDDIKEGESNSIVSSYNRNFPARNDGNKETLSFIGSPESVIGLALGGSLEFDFMNDLLINELGEEVKLSPPYADELPSDGFSNTLEGFVQPNQDIDVEVVINPESERLQVLTPFEKFNSKNYIEMTVFMKAVGKCTTDHISPAGKWLRFRGHLENISQNLFIGVNNAFTDESGTGINIFKDEIMPLPDLAKSYHENNINWIAIGDENYGEGSSREHAAMEPRFRGCKVVLVKSFARIHEANLKKQGVLPLTFNDKSDYEKINQKDKITIENLENIRPGEPINILITKEDGSTFDIVALHSLSDEQIKWFFSGSALNYIKAN